MLNLIVNGARVSYDSLEEAKDAARESGLGHAFWRETLTECAENGAMWNAFLNDLWQSEAEDEAERLDRTFPKDASRHWLLVALTLGGDDPWVAFLTEWEAQGDERILSAVCSSAFAPWLEQVQPKKHGLLVRAFGADAVKWPNDLLLKALKSEGTATEVAEWKAVVGKRKRPKPGEEMTITLPGGVPMTFCWCPAGSFMMGSDDGEKDEKPAHKVTLTQGFWLGKYQVTQLQWAQVINALGLIKDEDGKDISANPSMFSSDGWGRNCVSGLDTSDFPVENVSWDDCDRVINALNASRKDGLVFSLPTEAQWEYAARGGEKSRGYRYAGGNDLATVGWFYGNSGVSMLDDATWNGGELSSNKCRTHSVIEKDVGNELGLVGMSGNVWEWCQDWYGEDYYGQSPKEDPTGPASGTDRVRRGGCWHNLALFCRSAIRSGYEPGDRNGNLGLRLVCSAGPRR